MPTNEQRRQAAKRKLDRQLTRRAERAKRRRTYAVAGSAAAVLLVVGLVVLITMLGRDDDVDSAAAPPDAAPSSAAPSSAAPSNAAPAPVEIPTQRAPEPVRPEALPASVDCQYPADGRPPAKPVTPPAAGPTPTEGTVGITLETSAGAIPVTLDRALAPCAVANFVSLTEQGYLNETPCHRLTTGARLQVLQCGDPTGAGTGGPGYSFADETWPDIRYGRGYLAMANSGPDTNGSQFFLVYGDAALPSDYTVFGTVSDEGLEVIDEIARAGAQGGAPDGPPATPVQIQTAIITG
ncbi:MAG: peptidylprolyl isomerase [Actinomycetota bacterium]|nr:peptidylprolyl isomerase [Actinomycetota bacterium]